MEYTIVQIHGILCIFFILRVVCTKFYVQRTKFHAPNDFSIQLHKIPLIIFNDFIFFAQK